jgi:hypothetical protein
MSTKQRPEIAGAAADVVAVACVVVMYLAGHDIWNDTGQPDYWHLQGLPFFDVRVFVTAYYGLAILVLGQIAMRISRAVRKGSRSTV